MKVSDSERPSIAELQRMESAMTRLGWRASVGNFDKGHGNHITASRPDEHFGDYCVLISHLFTAHSAADMTGIAALRNAAPVLLEIAKAALAWRETMGAPRGDRRADAAETALLAALSKVKP